MYCDQKTHARVTVFLLSHGASLTRNDDGRHVDRFRDDDVRTIGFSEKRLVYTC